MPLDTTATEAPSIRGARPFVAHQRPPRIVSLGDDEATLAECEAQWIGQRGAITPEDDDQSDRWDDDARSPPRAARRGLGMDGLTAAATAALPDLPDRATLRSLMVAVGHLTYVPRERRYLLSAAAIREGVGRNVRPRRGFRFPMFFPESVAMIVRSLEWGHIKERVAALPTESERREHLARWHRPLPVKTLASLAGGSVRTMERALARAGSD